MQIAPVISGWRDGFQMSYCHGEALYEIQVENPDHCEQGVAWVELDGQRIKDGAIPLTRDLVKHRLLVRMGQSPPAVCQVACHVNLVDAYSITPKALENESTSEITGRLRAVQLGSSGCGSSRASDWHVPDRCDRPMLAMRRPGCVCRPVRPRRSNSIFLAKHG
ncbi:MAG TPA: hypothetical protein VGM23_17490 [Armatimonadota bacterium]